MKYSEKARDYTMKAQPNLQFQTLWKELESGEYECAVMVDGIFKVIPGTFADMRAADAILDMAEFVYARTGGFEAMGDKAPVAVPE